MFLKLSLIRGAEKYSKGYAQTRKPLFSRAGNNKGPIFRKLISSQSHCQEQSYSAEKGALNSSNTFFPVENRCYERGRLNTLSKQIVFFGEKAHSVSQTLKKLR